MSCRHCAGDANVAKNDVIPHGNKGPIQHVLLEHLFVLSEEFDIGTQVLVSPKLSRNKYQKADIGTQVLESPRLSRNKYQKADIGTQSLVSPRQSRNKYQKADTLFQLRRKIRKYVWMICNCRKLRNSLHLCLA